MKLSELRNVEDVRRYVGRSWRKAWLATFEKLKRSLDKDRSLFGADCGFCFVAKRTSGCSTRTKGFCQTYCPISGACNSMSPLATNQKLDYLLANKKRIYAMDKKEKTKQ